MSLEVKIEIRSVVKKATSQLPDGSTHNFTVLVQGLNGNQIEHFVNQVVFYLPSDSKQVKRNPPYIISGSAHASFRLPIEIFLHTSEARNKVRYSYYVYLPDKPVESAVNVKTLTFLNVPLDFRQRLLRGGAEVVKESNSAAVETRVKSEPVEIAENQEAAGSENNKSKKNVEHLVCRSEPTEGVNTQNEIQNDFPNTSDQTKDTSEQNGTLLIQDIYSFNDLMKENEVLKKENEELFQKSTQHEGVIVTYIDKLPALQKVWSTASTELSQLQKKSEDIEAEISSLKSTLQTLMSERLPHKEVEEIKRRRKISPASSPASENLLCFSSMSSVNESNTKHSHHVLSKDREMVMTQRNQDTISHAPHTALENNSYSGKQLTIHEATSLPGESSLGTVTIGDNTSPSIAVENKNTERQYESPSKQHRSKPKLKYFTWLQSQTHSLKSVGSDSKDIEDRPISENTMSSNCLLMPSVPHTEQENNSDSGKRSTIHEQACLPVSSSLGTVTIGDNTFPSIAVENEDSECENERPRKRYRRKPRLEDFTWLKSETKPPNSIGSTSEDINDRLTSESTITSNCENVPAVNRSLQTESIKCSSTKEVQEQAKGGLQVDLNQQKMDPVVSDFRHLENPLLNSITIFLPIPKDIKQNLCSAKQNIMPSVPLAGLVNNSDSVKKSIVDEQACLPVKSSLGAVTIGDNTASTIPNEDKNAIRRNKRIRKRERRKALKNLKRQTKASKSIGSVSEDINHRLTSENTITSNCENVPAVNSFLQTKSMKCVSTKEIQAKGGFQIDLNRQKKNPIASDFIHLENPSLDRRRTIFLPIPEGLKQNLGSVSEKVISSMSHTALVNNSDSGNQSTVDEQACVPAKNSLGTVTTGNSSSTIPVKSKSTAPENERSLKLNQNRERCKDFKRRASETKSSNFIGSVFKDIDDRLISEAKQNYYVHLLTELLTNPKNCPDISTLIFCVIDHLRNTAKNYLQTYPNDRENCIFLPSSERCIVSSIFEIEKKDMTSQFKLIENILLTIHHLLMSVKKYNLDGLASLCRVFTEICRRKNNLTKPLLLCADILKMKLPSPAYLIASIAGVWKEPFMLPSDQSEEAMLLLGSISLAAGKPTMHRDTTAWSYSIQLITEYFGFPCLPDVNAAIDCLKNNIISNCTQNSSDKLWMVTSSFVILASYMHWDWTKKHMIKEFIIPNLSKFAKEEPNETAFALFCDLCVDVYTLKGRFSYQVLWEYVKKKKNKGNRFVKEWVVISLIKYAILNKNMISRHLSNWIQDNTDKSSFGKITELLLRKKMYEEGLKSAKDVVIT